MNVANAATGEEVRAVSGFFIQDGETAQIGGLTLEFDSGLTIVAPTGAAIPVNEEMTLTDELGNTAVVRFVNDTLTSSDMVVTDGSQLFDGEVFSHRRRHDDAELRVRQRLHPGRARHRRRRHRRHGDVPDRGRLKMPGRRR